MLRTKLARGKRDVSRLSDFYLAMRMLKRWVSSFVASVILIMVVGLFFNWLMVMPLNKNDAEFMSSLGINLIRD